MYKRGSQLASLSWPTMAQSAAAFIFLSAVVLLCQAEVNSSDLQGLSFKKTRLANNEECEDLIEISGTEIQFRMTLTCDTARHLKRAITKGPFMVGDYRRSYMSFYSDSPDMLMVIQGAKTKTCTKLQKRNATEVTGLECEQFKIAMERVWDDTYKQDIDSDFIVKRTQELKDGRCVETIRFVGNGGGDSPHYVCEAGRNLEWMYIDGGLLLGNLKKNGFSFYSKTFGVFITIGNDGKCFKKEAAGGRLGDANVTDKECEEVTREVEEYWNKKYIRDAGSTVEVKLKPRFGKKKCKDIFEINGNGIHDEAKFDCNAKKPAEIIYIPNGFILTDLKKWNDKCYYSNSPNSMVVVKHKLGLKCTKFEYEGGAHTKKEVMTSSECNKVKHVIEEHVTRYESSTEVRVNRKNIYVNNECKEYIEVKGHGIYDIFKIDCEHDRKLLYFPSGFLLGDVRKHHTCLFSDSANRVAMVDQRLKTCKIFTYTVNEREVADLDSKACHIVKNVIEKHISGKYKD